MAKIENIEMINNSIVASVEGVRMVNAKAREKMKEELLNFINRSSKHVVLDLKNDTSVDTWGTVKLIAELAKLTETVSGNPDNCKNAFCRLNMKMIKQNRFFSNN